MKPYVTDEMMMISKRIEEILRGQSRDADEAFELVSVLRTLADSIIEGDERILAIIDGRAKIRG